MATPITHSVRHNLVRDAIVACARSFGLSATPEPRYFTYDNGKMRPDITVHTQPFSTTTDLTLVDETVSLEEAEKHKTAIHKDACAKQSSIFIPFAMHTRGTTGPQAEKFMRTIAKALMPSLQQQFIRELRHSVAIAAAKGRSNAIIAAADRAHMTY